MAIDADIAPADGEPPARPGLPPERVRRIMLGLVLAMFLAAIDQTMLSVALLSIGRDLLGFALMPWVVSGYLVASTVATPIYGKLSDIHGRRKLLLIAIAIHIGASVLCAFAQSMPQLVAFRILQGLGGGGLLALSQTVVADIAPGPERGRYQAYMSGTFAAAAVAGPVLGGVLTHYLSWRAIFVLYLPLGLAAFLVVRRALDHEVITPRKHSIDYLGALLLAGGLVALMIALTRLGQGHRLSDVSTLAMLAASATLLFLFALQERRAPEPLLPPEVVMNPVVALCCVLVGLQFFTLVGGAVLLPLAMQSIGRANANEVALRMLPMTLGVPFGAFLAGRYMFRTARYRGSAIIGGLLTVAGVVGIAFTATQPRIVTALLMLALGLGLGMTMLPSIVATQSAVAQRLVGVATSTAALCRTLGGAIGIALLTSVLFTQLRGVTPNPPAVVDPAVAATVNPILAALTNAPMEPLVDAFQVTFGVSALCAVGALVLALRLPGGLLKKGA